MNRWEFCYVDLLRHVVVMFSTTEGWMESKIKRDKKREDDSRDNATGRFVAQLGEDGWEMTNGSGDLRPVLCFKRKLTHP